MTVWRPPSGIRVKALGLHWRNDALLVMDVLDDAGNLKGVRPLGGTVEFGETWQVTLVREFKEELDIDVQITGAPMVFENI
ncbi:MAG: NUDIX domain-containing protein, partial [Amylibacter sp.]|nr:NUDIX domain-containing protein [Amylibacter sp.]